MTGMIRPFLCGDLAEGCEASVIKASPSVERRTPAKTSTPSAASLSETALPMPLEAPVTSEDLMNEFSGGCMKK
jgi:hypothetical protein